MKVKVNYVIPKLLDTEETQQPTTANCAGHIASPTHTNQKCNFPGATRREGRDPRDYYSSRDYHRRDYDDYYRRDYEDHHRRRHERDYRHERTHSRELPIPPTRHLRAWVKSSLLWILDTFSIIIIKFLWILMFEIWLTYRII